jgi:DNA polymerase
MLEILRADFRRIPELLALPAPDQPPPAEPELVVPEPEIVAEVAAEPEPEPEDVQLGLF